MKLIMIRKRRLKRQLMTEYKKEAKVLIMSLTVTPKDKYNAQLFMLDNNNLS